MGFFSSILDFSSLINMNCKNENPTIDKVHYVWINYLSNKEFVEHYKGIAYPLTNNINYTFNKFNSEQEFAEKINDNLIFINNINEKNDIDSEVKLLKNNESFELEINLNYNKNLSQIRDKITKEKNIEKINNNILFIYIDSLSRSHFFRKMKSVTNFLRKFYSDENNTSNYESFQFLKYQTFKKDYYKSSIETMFYIKTKKENIDMKNIHILSLLKENGYVTGQSANICSKEFYSYDFEKESKFFQKTKIEEYDHENIAMFCDPFYFDDSKGTNRKNVKGINSSIKSCLYGKNSFEYVLEYGYQFWNKYNNNKKFLRLGFFDGNEKTGEVIKYLDNYLNQFLIKLYEENLLENTIVFIASGQGNTNTDLFNHYNFEDFWIEKYIGTLFIIIDKNNLEYNENNLKNIRKNQQNMVTPYDIKETLVAIILNTFKNKINEKEVELEEFNIKGKSLFSYINPKERNCQKYKQTTEDICRCNEFS